ncbi:MAG: penicillin-binding protein [Bacilli bacterium]
MKREILNKNRNILSKTFIIVFFFFIMTFILRLAYLCLSGSVDGIDLKKFSNNRNTKKETLYALRGNIYDVNGNVLAQTINSYTVIAYLDESRSKASSKPLHVVDKQLTAEKLSPVLNMSKENILKLLSKKKAYQVELGPGGKGITELAKEQIEALDLPGIDFITTHKRYYPNNDFSSYVVGYTTNTDKGNMQGEMGIEKQYNDVMTGTNGYLQYQKDLNGYRFPNSKEIRKDKTDGNDIYLTIDSNVQMSLETAIKRAESDSNSDWIVAVVADAKTGKILGSGSYPSFNPNTKNITNYLNPLVSYAYEPGSTMKTYTYMAVFENNPNFDLSQTFQSGSYTIGEDTINDWNKTGFGTISYELGYTLSANTGVVNIIKNFLSREKLKDYFKELGFGEKTGIDLPNEYAGKINFKYDVEVVNAGFGQGITTTPIQHIKALTSIANNGVLLKPYIVEKTVNSNTKEVTYNAEIKRGKTVASQDTINRIKDLMYKVVNSPDSSTATGTKYKLEGYDLIGKTGTAQISNIKTGNYYSGKYDYITSFAGMYPKDDPQVIVYVAMQRSKNSSVLSETVKTIVKDTAKYLGIFEKAPELNKEVTTFTLPNYKNKNVELVKTDLNKNGATYVVIGDGMQVVNQYPKSNTLVNTKERVFLFTNDSPVKMPDLTGYSYKEAITILKELKIKYKFEKNDYVITQSIPSNTVITPEIEVIING